MHSNDMQSIAVQSAFSCILALICLWPNSAFEVSLLGLSGVLSAHALPRPLCWNADTSNIHNSTIYIWIKDLHFSFAFEHFCVFVFVCILYLYSVLYCIWASWPPAVSSHSLWLPPQPAALRCVSLYPQIEHHRGQRCNRMLHYNVTCCIIPSDRAPGRAEM